MVQLGPRAYMWGSAAYNAVRFFMPTRVTAAEVLKQRPAVRQCLYTVKEADCSHSALSVMLGNNITAVAVLDPTSLWVKGILTQTDYLRKVALPEGDARATSCASIMTPIQHTAYVLPDNDVESCLAVMAELKVHHLPVLDLRGAAQAHDGMDPAHDSSTAPSGASAADTTYPHDGFEAPPHSAVHTSTGADTSAGCGTSWGGAASQGVLALPLVDASSDAGRAAIAQARCTLLGVVSFEELLGLNKEAQRLSAARLKELHDEPSTTLKQLLQSMRGTSG